MAGADGRRGTGRGAQRAVSGFPLSGHGPFGPDPHPGRTVRRAGYGWPYPLLSAQRPAPALQTESEISQPVVSPYDIPLRIPTPLDEGAAGPPFVGSCVRHRSGKRHRWAEPLQRQAAADLCAAERLWVHRGGGQSGGGGPGLPMAGEADPRRAAAAGAGVHHRRPPPLAQGRPRTAPADAHAPAPENVAEDRRADADRTGTAGQGSGRGSRQPARTGQSRQPQPPQLPGLPPPLLRHAGGGPP